MFERRLLKPFGAPCQCSTLTYLVRFRTLDSFVVMASVPPVNPSLVPASGPSSSSVAPVAKAKAKAKAKATARPKPQIKTGWLSVKFSQVMELQLQVLVPSHPDFITAVSLMSWQEPPATEETDITSKKLANFQRLKQALKDMGWLVSATHSSDSWMYQIKFNKVGTKSYKRRMALRRLHVVATGAWPSF